MEPNSRTAIELAAEHGHFGIVKLFMKNITYNTNTFRYPTFIKACKGDNVDLVKLILPLRGVLPSQDDNEAFITACQYGRLDVSTLYRACEGGHTDVVKELVLNHGVDACISDNLALVKACHNRSIEFVEFLLLLPDVDVTCRNHSPVMVAAIKEDLGLLRVLLEVGGMVGWKEVYVRKVGGMVGWKEVYVRKVWKAVENGRVVNVQKLLDVWEFEFDS
ncbi:hypothetical protein HDU76_003233 [Blyttiomyces sp. JEL0837]|nr:hypothetical protein HDU76_003233 [Blyttiomyces sp. JEL0837]